MSNQNHMLQNLQDFWEKAKPVFSKIGNVFVSVWMTIRMICSAVFKVRGIFMSIPVAAVAIYLALLNQGRLPEMVGIVVGEAGGFSHMVPRSVAVYGPLAITGVCLLMVLCSRKTLYPWIISVFTLIIPVLIWILNLYIF